MKRFVLMLLLLIASPAMAGSSLFDQVRICVATSVKYTEYATLANDSTDSEHGAFVAFVQQEADVEKPKVKDLFIQLGVLAWLSRANGGANIYQDAMKLYDKCYSKLGTLT